MSKKKKPYRAVVQMGKHPILKTCETIEEARTFLAGKGGGVIEKRHYKMLHADGHGLGRIEYNPPLRLVDWQFVERVGSFLIPRPDATHGFWIESEHPLSSSWLPKSAFTTIYDNQSTAVATAIEGAEDPSTMEVRVVDLSSGAVVWRSTEEEYE